MVRDDRDDLLREMAELGILPMQDVTVLGVSAGRVHVRIGDREAMLSPEIAERVFVTPLAVGER